MTSKQRMAPFEAVDWAGPFARLLRLVRVRRHGVEGRKSHVPGMRWARLNAKHGVLPSAPPR